MSYFQNVFDFEFRPSLIGSDRQYQTGWKLKGNTNRSDYMLSGNTEPFNFTGNTVLRFSYAFDPSYLNYTDLDVTITGASIAAVTAQEVVNSLNSNSTFADLFVASVSPSLNTANSSGKIIIKGKRSRGQWRAYVVNYQAEGVLQFNKNAPIGQFPELFEKYAIENRWSWPDVGADRIVLLNPGANAIDSAYITAAGYNPLLPLGDWQLLAGSSDAYWFTKSSYLAGVLSSEIVYPAGAGVGFAAKKITYKYDGGGNLTERCEIPYVLQSGDLMTP
jgi:hypothetical protein